MKNDFVNTITTSNGTTYDVQDKRLTVTAADAGKVVSVDENGNLTLSEPSSGTKLYCHEVHITVIGFGNTSWMHIYSNKNTEFTKKDILGMSHYLTGTFSSQTNNYFYIRTPDSIHGDGASWIWADNYCLSNNVMKFVDNHTGGVNINLGSNLIDNNTGLIVFTKEREYLDSSWSLTDQVREL